jgi:dynein intermediate chain
VLYNKEIQTAAFDSDSSTEDEDAARHRLAHDRARELEAERLRERELEEERSTIVTAPEFLDFIEQSSKIVQRALNDKYDYIRDYAVSGEDGGYGWPS